MYLFSRPEVLYLYGNRGQLFRLDKTDGGLISLQSLDVDTAYAPFMTDKNIYFGSSDRRILKFPLSAAARVGADRPAEITKLKNAPTVIFSSDDEFLYVGDKSGGIAGIDIRGKKPRWQSRTGAEVLSIKEIGDSLLISSADNYVYLLAKRDGRRVWKKRLESKISGDIPTREKIAVLSPLGNRSATVIELEKGSTINRIELSGEDENYFVGGASLIGDILVFSTLRGLSAFADKDCKSGE